MSENNKQELVQDLVTGKLSRRQFVARALALGISASTIGSVLAACGQPSNSAGAPAAGSASTPAANADGVGTPAAGGEGGEAAAEATPTPYKPQTYGSESAKVKIRYWTILGSVDGIVMNDLVRQFVSQNPDIAVESLQGLTDFVQKMQAANISGTAPDVALIRHTYTGPFVNKNMLSTLEQTELDQAGIRKEDYDPTVWEFTQYQGNQYTVPLDIHCHAMLYNKKLLGDAGLKVPTTLQEWEQVAGAVSKNGVIGYQTFALGAGAQEYLAWYWYGLQKQFGGELFKDDGRKAAFNTTEGIECVKWMKSIQQKANPKNAPTTDLARTGKVATWPDGPWITTLFFDKEKAPAAPDIDVATLPQHDPQNKAVWGQSHQFAVPRQQNQDQVRREAVFTFIDWMTKHSVDWAMAGQVPANNAAREEALSKNNIYMQNLKVWASELPYVAYIPSVPQLLEVLPRISANVEAAILGKVDVEAALKKAESEVNSILAG